MKLVASTLVAYSKTSRAFTAESPRTTTMPSPNGSAPSSSALVRNT